MLQDQVGFTTFFVQIAQFPWKSFFVGMRMTDFFLSQQMMNAFLQKNENVQEKRGNNSFVYFSLLQLFEWFR